MQKEFTDALYELFVQQNLSLTQSMLIISRKPKRDAVKRAAFLIYSSLEGGCLFSNALKTCSEIKFDDVYISFILLAEKNGDLKSTVSYLRQKLKRKKEERKKLVEASIYPAFVILLSIAASVFVGVYTNTADFLSRVKLKKTAPQSESCLFFRLVRQMSCVHYTHFTVGLTPVMNRLCPFFVASKLARYNALSSAWSLGNTLCWRLSLR